MLRKGTTIIRDQAAEQASAREGPVAGSVTLDRLSKRFGDVTAVDDVSLIIRPGEMVALLGASGSGKSTILRMIAGLESPTSGEIRIDGTRVNETPVHKRGLGLVPQQYGLIPHLTVAENVAFGLRVRRMGRVELREKVGRILALTQLHELADRSPTQLSGGQAQRVALARAMVVEPRVLLLDEPLAALDRALREHMQAEIKQLQRRVGVTTVFVTHDQQEALSLADRVGVVEAGRLVQCDPPPQLYAAPRSRHVARFMGIPNFFTGTVDVRDDTAELVTPEQRFRLADRGAHDPGARSEGVV